MKHRTVFAEVLVCAALLATPAYAHKAHEHGAARMNLSVEGQEVEIELEVPLADLTAFEHAPETDAEKKAVRDAAAILHDAGKLFMFPAEAGCRSTKISLESDVLSDDLLAAPGARKGTAKHGAAEKKERHDDHEKAEKHADLDAEWTFVCRNPEKLRRLEVGLFKHFPSLREIDVQMTTPGKQGAAELTPQSAILRW
ncbi:MAG: DUF2796 domain-containing protein [Desulfovibrio sp.]|nr:DUF2796 domain-containing protein [Desulfovibrio sp.]